MIRRMVAADYDVVVRLWIECGLPVRPTGRDARGPFLKQLRAFATTYLVAELDDTAVGTVLGTHDGRKGWINRLAVHPEHRGRGIARRLLEACEEALGALGIEIFAAMVETHNELPIPVLERCGYLRDVPVYYFRKRLRDDI